MSRAGVCVVRTREQAEQGMSVSSRFLRLMILGPPGSGKGTIGKRIADAFYLKHVSSGDALRDHMAKSTPIGLQAKEFVDSG